MSHDILAIAWDVDGTLVDSEPLHHRALIDACGRYGYDISGIDDQTYVGVSIEDVWDDIRVNLPVALERAEWLARINAHYVENRMTVIPLAGAIDTVVLAAKLGLRQVSVSNSHREIVRANLDATGVEEHMEFLVCLDDVKNGKPSPEPYETACRKLGLAPQNVLAVEDSATGAASALAAGLQLATVGSVCLRGETSFGHFPSLVELAEKLMARAAA